MPSLVGSEMCIRDSHCIPGKSRQKKTIPGTIYRARIARKKHYHLPGKSRQKKHYQVPYTGQESPEKTLPYIGQGSPEKNSTMYRARVARAPGIRNCPVFYRPTQIITSKARTQKLRKRPKQTDKKPSDPQNSEKRETNERRSDAKISYPRLCLEIHVRSVEPPVQTR